MPAKNSHAYASLDPATASRVLFFAYPSKSAKLKETLFSRDGNPYRWGPGTEVKMISRAVYGTDGTRDEKSFEHADRFRKSIIKSGKCTGVYHVNSHIETDGKVTDTLNRLNADCCKTNGSTTKDHVDEEYDILPEDEQDFIPIWVEEFDDFKSAKPGEKSKHNSQIIKARERVDSYVHSWDNATWATDKGPLMINKSQGAEVQSTN